MESKQNIKYCVWVYNAYNLQNADLPKTAIIEHIIIIELLREQKLNKVSFYTQKYFFKSWNKTILENTIQLWNFNSKENTNEYPPSSRKITQNRK